MIKVLSKLILPETSAPVLSTERETVFAKNMMPFSHLHRFFPGGKKDFRQAK